jgi:hypothetical protein
MCTRVVHQLSCLLREDAREIRGLAAASQLHLRRPYSSKGGVMRTRVGFATTTAIALGMTVGLLAQNPPSSTPPSGAQAMAVKAVTVTGCLKPVQPSATTTTGTTGSTSPQPKFVLTNLVTTPAATTGTTGGTATAVTITEYRLDFDEAKLTPHVGHKIEISGTPVMITATPPLPATVGTLKVENVKMIAAACP